MDAMRATDRLGPVYDSPTWRKLRPAHLRDRTGPSHSIGTAGSPAQRYTSSNRCGRRREYASALFPAPPSVDIDDLPAELGAAQLDANRDDAARPGHAAPRGSAFVVASGVVVASVQTA